MTSQAREIEELVERATRLIEHYGEPRALSHYHKETLRVLIGDILIHYWVYDEVVSIRIRSGSAPRGLNCYEIAYGSDPDHLGVRIDPEKVRLALTTLRRHMLLEDLADV